MSWYITVMLAGATFGIAAILVVWYARYQGAGILRLCFRREKRYTQSSEGQGDDPSQPLQAMHKGSFELDVDD